MSTTSPVRRQISLGKISVPGQDYEAIVIQVQNKPLKMSWVDFAKVQIKKMGLVLAKEDELRACVRLLCQKRDPYISRIAAVGEYMKDEDGRRIYPKFIQNTSFPSIWEFSRYHLRRHLGQYTFYLALRPLMRLLSPVVHGPWMPIKATLRRSQVSLQAHLLTITRDYEVVPASENKDGAHVHVALDRDQQLFLFRIEEGWFLSRSWMMSYFIPWVKEQLGTDNIAVYTSGGNYYCDVSTSQDYELFMRVSCYFTELRREMSYASRRGGGYEIVDVCYNQDRTEAIVVSALVIDGYYDIGMGSCDPMIGTRQYRMEVRHLRLSHSRAGIISQTSWSTNYIRKEVDVRTILPQDSRFENGCWVYEQDGETKFQGLPL